MKTPIGKLTCPIAAAAGDPHDGEVFETDSKKRPLYWRCECGTIQPLLPSGQANIRKLVKPLTLAETDDAKKAAAIDAETEAEETAKRGRRESNVLKRFFDMLKEDEQV